MDTGLIDSQSVLEHLMLDQGASRYQTKQTKAVKRSEELTSAQNKLFKGAVSQVAEAMEAALICQRDAVGRKPTWFAPLQVVGSVKAAVIALHWSFSGCTSRQAYVSICGSIGRQVELEMIHAAIEQQDAKLYDTIVARAKTSKRRDKQEEVFVDSAKDLGLWEEWSQDERVKLGAGLLNFVLQETSFFNVALSEETQMERELELVFTQETIDRLAGIEEREAWMQPVFQPMVVAPNPWTSVSTGCYKDARLAKQVPMVKTRRRDHLSMIDAAVKSKAPFVSALNHIQSVPLRINQWILNVIGSAFEKGVRMRGFPDQVIKIDPKWEESKKRQVRKSNHETRSQISNFHRDLEEARRYAEFDQLYQPAQLDWRGRVYAKPHLNHQRSDYCKAMFEFARGCYLTDDGVKWLAIHVATQGAFEKVDKAPFIDRIKWTRANTDRILKTVEDPFADLWWTQADSPFVFLASCKAWADFILHGDAVLCHLPVHIDGSCSGLAHFSALLRDPIGATATSLSPGEKPADVYKQVADVVLQQALDDKDHPLAQQWIAFGINRSVVKRCVMTYVYSSKVYGFAQHLWEDIMLELRRDVQAGRRAVHPFGDDEGKAASTYMAKLVWAAVAEVVKAASEGMAWLQEVAGLLASEGKPVVWTTPAGFPVINAYYKPKTERIKLTLWDRELHLPKTIKPVVQVGETDELLSHRVRNSISPNFIHSLDSSHLMAVVNQAATAGITDFLLVHDSFGCLPSDMERFSSIVRETLVEMYTAHDPLKSLYEASFLQLSEKGRRKLSAPPVKGTFDLNLVLSSPYAFA